VSPRPGPRERSIASREDGASAQGAAAVMAGGPQISRLLARTEQRLAEIAQGHGQELGAHATQTLTAGGKRLRPLLVFLSAGDRDSDRRVSAESAGDRDSDRLVSAAVAVELVHTATLVHDDVLDRAAMRRGRPTVFEGAGRGVATATGDLLFSRAFSELAEAGDPAAMRALSAAATALARGELMQRADAWSATVSAERYLERCELKTARLFEASCRLGAILGSLDAGPGAEQALALFGMRIGIAFQIFDDVLDVSGPLVHTGKHRGADLLDGTVTLPLILARERDIALGEIDLRAVGSRQAAVDALCERIESSGALGRARAHALSYVAEAKAALAEVALGDSRRDALELVADGVVERYG